MAVNTQTFPWIEWAGMTSRPVIDSKHIGITYQHGTIIQTRHLPTSVAEQSMRNIQIHRNCFQGSNCQGKPNQLHENQSNNSFHVHDVILKKSAAKIRKISHIAYHATEIPRI